MAGRFAAAARRWLGWSRLPGIVRRAAAPGVILILFAITVAISLGALLYAQHASSSIVQHDMRIVTSLSEAAAQFDHADGNLYRLMVDKAAGGAKVDIPRRAATIKTQLTAIRAQLHAIKPSLRADDQKRTEQVLAAIVRYSDTVDVVAAMLDVNFSASAAMLAPFRSNADQVIADVNGMMAAGIADARRHAASSAERTRWLVVVVATAMVLLALLAVAWLAIASHRGIKLRDEMRLRETAERNALVLARHDPLTNLFNRRVFVGEMAALIAAGTRFAVALLDLDDFKAVNDLYGHAAGDAMLRSVAERLAALGGEGAVLARLGGDEFAAILPDRPLPELARLFGALATELRRPVPWDGTDLHIGGSIGVSRFPDDATAVDTLLHAADVAMYDAKQASKGTVRFFDRAMETARLEQRRLEDELRIGIATGQVQPFYQPIVRLCDRQVCGFEILARWRHPRLGLVTPDRFIALAEQTHQIGPLTEVLLRQACRHLHRLSPDVTLSLNISPSQLIEPDLASRLLGIIRAAGHAPERFEIELTEDAVMDDAEVIARTITTLRANGISVALDDFGTGFSSLSILRRLQFDRIKIDRTFVQTITTSYESQKLVDAVINLATSFGMSVTAEGIESEQAASMLLARRCTLGQGYVFGRPIDIDGLAASLPLLPAAVRAHARPVPIGQD